MNDNADLLRKEARRKHLRRVILVVLLGIVGVIVLIIVILLATKVI